MTSDFFLPVHRQTFNSSNCEGDVLYDSKAYWNIGHCYGDRYLGTGFTFRCSHNQGELLQIQYSDLECKNKARSYMKMIKQSCFNERIVCANQSIKAIGNLSHVTSWDVPCDKNAINPNDICRNVSGVERDIWGFIDFFINSWLIFCVRKVGLHRFSVSIMQPFYNRHCSSIRSL